MTIESFNVDRPVVDSTLSHELDTNDHNGILESRRILSVGETMILVLVSSGVVSVTSNGWALLHLRFDDLERRLCLLVFEREDL